MGADPGFPYEGRKASGLIQFIVAAKKSQKTV